MRPQGFGERRPNRNRKGTHEQVTAGKDRHPSGIGANPPWGVLLLILILLLLWGAGNFVPSSPVRGNNLIHLVLVLVVILIVYQLLVGGGPLRLHRL